MEVQESAAYRHTHAALVVENSNCGEDEALKRKRIKYTVLYDGSNGVELQTRFLENSFPYNLSGGYHWILWYNCQQKPYSNDRITDDIQHNLTTNLGQEILFDFAW